MSRAQEQKIENRLSALKEHLTVVREDYNRHVQMLSDASEELASIITDTNSLEKQSASLSEEIKGKQDVSREVSAQEKNFRKSIAELQAKLESLDKLQGKKLSVAKSAEQNLQRRIKTKEDKIKRMESTFESSKGLYEDKIKTLKDFIIKLTADESFLMSKIKDTQATIDTQRKTIDLLKKDIDKLIEEKQSAEKSVKSVREKLDERDNALKERERAILLREKDIRVIMKRLNTRYRQVFPNREIKLK